MRKIYLLILVSFFSMNNSFASEAVSDEPKEITWWLNIGFFGKTFGEDINGSGVVSGISVNNRFGLFTIRNSSYDNGPSILDRITDCLILRIFGGCDEDNITRIEESAFLYGKSFDDGKFSISTGIAKVTSENSLDDIDEFSTYGLPIEVHWRPKIGKYLGAGVLVFGNINNKQSFAGIYITFQLGKLK